MIGTLNFSELLINFLCNSTIVFKKTKIPIKDLS